MLVEQLDELGEVRQGPGQTVDFVDNDDVNLASPYVLQKSLQRRPVGVATGEAAIVVFAAQEGPASVGLASDISLGGIILGIERVKVLLKVLVGRDAVIDRAAGVIGAQITLLRFANGGAKRSAAKMARVKAGGH